MRPNLSSTASTFDGKLSIAFDRTTNFIKVVGQGLWSIPYINRHIAEFEAVIAEARQAARPSRILVDLRDTPMQTPEVISRLERTINQMLRPPERSAILVASSLMKSQMKQTLNPETHAVFTSERAAEIWLDAHSIGYDDVRRDWNA